MKKLNKKGITLIELIVSFAIVSVAMIYFYQTIVDLHRIYKNSSKSTEEFVNKSYALRVIHAYIDEKTITSLSTDINVCTQYLLSYCNTLSISDDGNYKKIELKDSSNNVLATTYYYAPSEIAKAVEEIMVDGNVGSYTSFENAIKKYVETETEDGKIQLKNHEIKIEIGSDNKIEYKLFETDKTEPIYSVKNSKSINEIIDSISDKNQTNIQNKVQELIGGGLQHH